MRFLTFLTVYLFVFPALAQDTPVFTYGAAATCRLVALVRPVGEGAPVAIGCLDSTAGTFSFSAPSPTARGGILSSVAPTSKWVGGYDATGVAIATQPTYGDIAGIIGTGALPSPSALGNYLFSSGDKLSYTSGNQYLPNFQLSNTRNDDRAGYITMLKSRAGSNLNDLDPTLNIVSKQMYNGQYVSSADISFYTDGTCAGAGDQVACGSRIYINPSSNQQPLGQWWNIDHAAHVGVHQETAPTLSACGTLPNLRTGSSDAYGALTEGSGGVTGCTVTFANAFRSKPFCVVTPASQLSSFSYNVSSTNMTIVNPANTFTEISWHCADSYNP